MKKLLNIDGGGVRVYMSLLLLDYIETRTNKKIVDLFDYFAGVSASSIILAGLLTKYTVKEMLLLFKEITNKIFYRSYYHILKSGFGMFDSKYTDYYINIELQKLFENTKISDIKKPLSIISYDINTSKSISFYSYKNSDLMLWEIIRGSTAAPTYFPSYKTDNYNLIDGGVVANNLSELIFIDAMEHFGKDEEYIQVSIGTGIFNNNIKETPSGLWSWSSAIVDTFFRASSSNMMISLEKISQIENLKFFHRLDFPEVGNLPYELKLDDILSFDTMDMIFLEWLDKNSEYIIMVCNDLVK
jgi:patatin-like phospholipase/acyl hydrolase